MSLKLDELVFRKLYTRDIDPLASTQFTYSRFLVPHLMNYKGWAVFCDCDFIFLNDVKNLMENLDTSKAVYCVKHDYTPKEKHKMDGQKQTIYLGKIGLVLLSLIALTQAQKNCQFKLLIRKAVLFFINFNGVMMMKLVRLMKDGIGLKVGHQVITTKRLLQFTILEEDHGSRSGKT